MTLVVGGTLNPKSNKQKKKKKNLVQGINSGMSWSEMGCHDQTWGVMIRDGESLPEMGSHYQRWGVIIRDGESLPEMGVL